MRAVLVPLEIDLALPPAGSVLRKAAGRSMGTGWSAQMLVPAGVTADLEAALQRELGDIVAQMSHWEEGSLLSRFNRAPGGTWHALPAQFYEVVDFALRVHEDAAGAYDPAAGALVNLWGFGPDARFDQTGFNAPSAAAIAAVMARRETATPQLDRASRRLLQPGGAILDFSSIAKGYGVDRLGQCLERHGVRHYLVEVGGELRGAGMKPGGEPWWVEIEGVPDAAAGPQAVVALHGLAIATSGDYRRYFQHAPRRASHTLDPRSGHPVANDVASCTVVATTCMAADALSTALTVMGAEAGLAFAGARGIAARYLLRQDGALHEHVSDAWRELLQ
ncbi:FAD:protein FMN transferase [Massilia yuzhufengensis]|uniref:FAD:protein FMN transferase n=1 Tax=Massilia yuzhufengensis TaxID=1164594 RepID=A0A1I1HDT2_9BURK|nr:FAD:protein FMN transferase [Massilia yuzhufengensis]SFC21976.1 thiamine biosynthesis lipoprotein [Massilia yuzhufengensis]